MSHPFKNLDQVADRPQPNRSFAEIPTPQNLGGQFISDHDALSGPHLAPGRTSASQVEPVL